MRVLHFAPQWRTGVDTMPSPTKDLVRFGPFELDLNAWQLRKSGMKLRIPLQPLQLLAVLLEHPGATVRREELQQRLWTSEVFVDFEQGLNKNIGKLREVLGDSAESPSYIETIPRIGYRFIACGTNNSAWEVGPQADLGRAFGLRGRESWSLTLVGPKGAGRNADSLRGCASPGESVGRSQPAVLR